jgi:hypothetical protein
MAVAKARQPQPRRRKDPRPARLTGVTDDVLINKDPKKHYVLAYLGHDTGVPYYKTLGYEVERYREGGVAFSGFECRPGEPMENRGALLMSIDAERRQEIEEYGPNGRTGQDLVDKIEDIIIDPRKTVGHDPQRGLHAAEIRNKYFSVRNLGGADDEEPDAQII